MNSLEKQTSETFSLVNRVNVINLREDLVFASLGVVVSSTAIKKAFGTYALWLQVFM